MKRQNDNINEDKNGLNEQMFKLKSHSYKNIPT